MTIFLKVCQELLPDYLRAISERSTAADQSLRNTVLSTIGFGRDLELSASKREILEELLAALKTLQDDVTDLNTCEALKRLIDTSREKARIASDSKKLNEGNFGPEMHSVVELLREVYATVDKLKMLDIKDSTDPSFTFYYYLALYDSKKVAEAHYESIVARLAKKTLLFTPSELSLDKEKLVKDAREECAKKLSWLNQSLPNLSECRYAIVLEMIHKVTVENQGLCRRHDPSITLGKQLELKIPVLGPSNGFLDECMKQAERTIEAAETARKASTRTTRPQIALVDTSAAAAAEEEEEEEESSDPAPTLPDPAKEHSLPIGAASRTSPPPIASVASVSLFPPAPPSSLEDAAEGTSKKGKQKVVRKK